jgi:hypothetical protein
MLPIVYLVLHYQLVFACAGNSYEPLVPALLQGRCTPVLLAREGQ